MAWDFGDGEVGLGSDVQHVFAAPGTRTVTASATDAAGNVRTASATILVTAPNGPGGPGGPGTPSVDAAAPVISGATLAAKRFRIGKATTALAAAAQRAPKGTALKLTLSEQATLQILVVRRQPGRRAKGQCKASVKKGARCTLRATRATLQRALPAGGASIPFSGRLASGRLPAGTYELVLVATDPSGNRSAPVTLGFSIVR